MATIVPEGYGLASFILTGSVGTAPYVTTLGVDLNAFTGSELEVPDLLFETYRSSFMPLTNNDLSLVSVSLLLNDGEGTGSIDSSQAAAIGTREVPMAPTAMALIARKVTGVLGRRGRGRMFMPGMLADGDVQENGQIEPASVNIFQAALNSFYDELMAGPDGGDPLPPVLLHSSNVLPLPNATQIIGFTAAPLVGWIRGRIR